MVPEAASFLSRSDLPKTSDVSPDRFSSISPLLRIGIVLNLHFIEFAPNSSRFVDGQYCRDTKVLFVCGLWLKLLTIMQRIRRFGQLTDGIVDHGFMRGLFNTWASLLKQRKLKYYPRRRPKTNLREHTQLHLVFILPQISLSRL